MKVKLDIAALGRSEWHEYAVRFAFGGAVTVLAGLVARQYGPGVGGLFLAFPAIFPATATLLEKHEKEKKERVGGSGIIRGRVAAGADAAGAAMGSVGLIAFALIVWLCISHHNVAMVLCMATAAWFAVGVLIWEVRETLVKRLRLQLRHRARKSGSQVHT